MNAEVIATFGRHLLLRDADGDVLEARPRGRSLGIVCGDRVRCERNGAELLVAEVLPRRRLLRRTTLRGTAEPVVANITQVAAVLAPVPAPDLFMLDRYLCAAECAQLEAVVVLNKNDIGIAASTRRDLEAHEALGYRVVSVNAVGAEGSGALLPALRGHTTILVGQSGAGKSSLTRLLTGDDGSIAVGTLVRDEEGRHTTTASRMYECGEGIRIIDSPGVRDFAPAIDDLDAPTLGFREVARLSSGCRFLDCRHMQEPACAVRAAVAAGSMDARRYESYRRLRRLYEQLCERRPLRGRPRR